MRSNKPIARGFQDFVTDMIHDLRVYRGETIEEYFEYIDEYYNNQERIYEIIDILDYEDISGKRRDALINELKRLENEQDYFNRAMTRE